MPAGPVALCDSGVSTKSIHTVSNSMSVGTGTTKLPSPATICSGDSPGGGGCGTAIASPTTGPSRRKRTR